MLILLYIVKKCIVISFFLYNCLFFCLVFYVPSLIHLSKLRWTYNFRNTCPSHLSWSRLGFCLIWAVCSLYLPHSHHNGAIIPKIPFISLLGWFSLPWSLCLQLSWSCLLFWKSPSSSGFLETAHERYMETWILKIIFVLLSHFGKFG